MQAADGSLEADLKAAQGQVAEMTTAVEALAPRFPHQREYLDATIADLRGWIESGFGKPAPTTPASRPW